MEEKKDSYASKHYEVKAFGGNHITTDVPDMLARVRNILVVAFRRAVCIPKIIVVVCESDIIDAMQASQYGITQHYEQAIEWLIDEHTDIIDKFRGYLPSKARKKQVSLAVRHVGGT